MTNIIVVIVERAFARNARQKQNACPTETGTRPFEFVTRAMRKRQIVPAMNPSNLWKMSACEK